MSTKGKSRRWLGERVFTLVVCTSAVVVALAIGLEAPLWINRLLILGTVVAFCWRMAVRFFAPREHDSPSRHHPTIDAIAASGGELLLFTLLAVAYLLVAVAAAVAIRNIDAFRNAGMGWDYQLAMTGLGPGVILAA